MILKITKRIFLTAMLTHISTGFANNSAINPLEVVTRLGSAVIGGIAVVWAKDRLAACWHDVVANLDGQNRRVPTFTEDLQNIAATGGCTAALLTAAMGLHEDLPFYLKAVAFETTIMGGLFLGLKYGAGLKDMRLRHAMVGTMGIGALRQAAVRYEIPHLSFGVPVNFNTPSSRVIYGN